MSLLKSLRPVHKCLLSAHLMATRPLFPLRAFALAPDLKDKLEKLVQSDKVVVFMKGVPDSPRCGFSNAVIQVLRMHAVPYQAYDVFADEDLRLGMKEFSNWQTFPQVYIDGQFVGGCDIILDMHRSTDLIETLKNAGIESALAKKM